jgi:hypothetical protein
MNITPEERKNLWEERKELTKTMQYTHGDDNCRVKERLERLDKFLFIENDRIQNTIKLGDTVIFTAKSKDKNNFILPKI